jgi:hypothetical protein
MIAKRIPAGIHQPSIGVNFAALVQPVQQGPGFTHVTQHNIHTFILVLASLASFPLLPFCLSNSIFLLSNIRVLLAFEIKVARLADHFLGQQAAVIAGREDRGAFRSAAVGVTQKGLDLGLDVRGEEIALDC